MMKQEKLMACVSGAKRSDRIRRGRFDLVSPHGLRRLPVHYEEGAEDKGERNREKGWRRRTSSITRRIVAQ